MFRNALEMIKILSVSSKNKTKNRLRRSKENFNITGLFIGKRLVTFDFKKISTHFVIVIFFRLGVDVRKTEVFLTQNYSAF